MRALLVVRPNAATHPGGDLIDAERTASELRELGVEATLVPTAVPDPRGYDVVHVFGIFEPATAKRQLESVRASGTPLVLSPIWLDLFPLMTLGPLVERALAAHGSAGVERRLRKVQARAARPWRNDAPAKAARKRLGEQQRLAAAADVLLPASNIEAYLYGVGLGAGATPFVIARMGVDAEAFAAQAPVARSGVLCAGRIEPKKNQAALLYALRDVDVDVTIVGIARDAPYLELCRRWATPRTHFVEYVERSELHRMMARAAVHAMPSWLEIPGLSSVEAAAAGARVVVGDAGVEREYFGSHADYARPDDPASMRAAVVRALSRPPRVAGDALEQRLRSFSWRRTATATLEAYELAVALRAQGAGAAR